MHCKLETHLIYYNSSLYPFCRNKCISQIGHPSLLRCLHWEIIWDISPYETYCFGQVHKFGFIQTESGTFMLRYNFVLNVRWRRQIVGTKIFIHYFLKKRKHAYESIILCTCVHTCQYVCIV